MYCQFNVINREDECSGRSFQMSGAYVNVVHNVITVVIVIIGGSRGTGGEFIVTHGWSRIGGAGVMQGNAPADEFRGKSIAADGEEFPCE
jgi:hypothetical protein